MQGTRKPPTSEVVEASKSGSRNEHVTRPPAPMGGRRDDRAEPDDDPGSSRIDRVDVVNVDAGRESAMSGVSALRRELTKLNAQAAAVERSLDEQRRDRSEALDRLERATERVIHLEARLATVESDLVKTRNERDDLRLAIEAAKTSTAELGKLREQLLELRSTAAEAATAGPELAQARQETEQAKAEAARAKAEAARARDEAARTKEEVERVSAEAAKAKADADRAEEEARQAKAEASRAREATEKAKKLVDLAEQDAVTVGEQATHIREEAAKVREEAAKAREEAAKAREEGERLEKELAKAREEGEHGAKAVAKTSEELTQTREQLERAVAESNDTRAELRRALDDGKTLQSELTEARQELEKVQTDLSRAKEDNTRDRSTARDRIDLLDRALDDARGATQRTEGLLETARDNEARLERELDAARSATAQTEKRASAMAQAHASLEDSLRRLREDIAGAFARVAQGTAHGADAEPFQAAPSVRESKFPSSPASRSVPPPGSAIEATHAAAVRGSMPPPTYASVPPQIHESNAPRPHDTAPPPSTYDSVLPDSRKTAPPPPIPSAGPAPIVPDDVDAGAGAPPSQATGTLVPPFSGVAPPPPTMRGSSPPAAVSGLPVATSVQSTSVQSTPVQSTSVRPAESDIPPTSSGWPDPSDLKTDSAPTRSNRPASVFPSAGPGTREDLLVKLVDPDHASAAAMDLRKHPEWLEGPPPPTLLAALAGIDYDAESPLFELARAWNREALSGALVAALRAETEPRVREHFGWLLKHFAATSSWKTLADLARSDEEPSQLRRWLIEGLDRLAAGRSVGWKELGELVTSIATLSTDPLLRDGVVGILVSLDRSDEKIRLLLEILRADDDEIVLASAVDALASVLPMELDPVIVERLLGHPSAGVQRAVRMLIERARHTK